MTKLDEALLDHECASDATLGKNIDVLANAARAYAALLKLAPEIAALVEAVDEFKPQACSSEIALHLSAVQEETFIIDYSEYIDKFKMKSVSGDYLSMYQKCARAARNSRPTLKAIHDNLTQFGKDTTDDRPH